MDTAAIKLGTVKKFRPVNPGPWCWQIAKIEKVETE
jgi:hypothetical protein